MGTTTRILTACAAAAALFNAPLARAASDVPRKSAAASLPTTVAEHEAMAKTYEDKVALYQKEAQFHREMLADMQKSHPETTKSGMNQEVAKMEKHCTALIKDAEKLAADTQKAADYHHLRAKELQGQ